MYIITIDGVPVAGFENLDDLYKYCDIEMEYTSYDVTVAPCYSHEYAQSELFQTCDECGDTMVSGYTHDDGWRCCEPCMARLIDEGIMRASVDNLDDRGANVEDGYYDELIDGKWYPSAIYWTDWS